MDYQEIVQPIPVKIGTTHFSGTQHAGLYKSTDEGEGMFWTSTNLHDTGRLQEGHFIQGGKLIAD